MLYYASKMVEAFIAGMVVAIDIHIIMNGFKTEKQLNEIIALHQTNIQELRAVQEQIQKFEKPSSVAPPSSYISSLYVPPNPSTTPSTTPTTLTNNPQTRLFSTFARNARNMLR